MIHIIKSQTVLRKNPSNDCFNSNYNYLNVYLFMLIFPELKYSYTKSIGFWIEIVSKIIYFIFHGQHLAIIENIN